MKHEWLGRVISTVAMVVIPTTIYAQDAPDAPAQRWVSAAVGLMDFDLGGVGQTAVIAGRYTWPVTGRVAIEGGASIGWPQESFGRTTIYEPEVNLQYHWRIARVRPYAGGGIGFTHRRANVIVSDTDLSFSAAGGARIGVTGRMSILGEMRLRCIEWGCAASVAEWVGGVSWRVGR